MNLNSQNHKQNIDSYLLPQERITLKKYINFLMNTISKEVWDIGCASGDLPFAPSSIDF